VANVQAHEGQFSRRRLKLESFFQAVKSGAAIRLVDHKTGDATAVPEVVTEQTRREARRSN
jgi:hypothetical protein